LGKAYSDSVSLSSLPLGLSDLGGQAGGAGLLAAGAGGDLSGREEVIVLCRYHGDTGAAEQAETASAHNSFE
jgi:hypothetical protein